MSNPILPNPQAPIPLCPDHSCLHKNPNPYPAIAPPRPPRPEASLCPFHPTTTTTPATSPNKPKPSLSATRSPSTTSPPGSPPRRSDSESGGSGGLPEKPVAPWPNPGTKSAPKNKGPRFRLPGLDRLMNMNMNMNMKLNIFGDGKSRTEKERAGYHEEWDPAPGAKANRNDCNMPGATTPSGSENPTPSGVK